MVSKFVKSLGKQSIKIRELIDVSYHEAGHTIYGLLKFIKISSVSIYHNKEKQGGEGVTIYESVIDLGSDSCDFDLLNYCVKSEVGLSYAGLCAEKILYKNISGSNRSFSFLRDGSYDDTFSAYELIKKYNLAPSGRKRYLFKQKMINETNNLLTQHWTDIVIVSNALFQKKKLYYSDLKSLLIKKSINKVFWKKQFKNIESICDNKSTIDLQKLKSIVLA